MKSLTVLLSTLLSITSAVPAPAPAADPNPSLPLSARFPLKQGSYIPPLYNHRWSSNVWTPATDNVGRAKNTDPSIETISTFDIGPADVNTTFQLLFWTESVHGPPQQAIQVYSNNIVPASASGVPVQTSNGRDKHFATFLADGFGDARKYDGSPEDWREVRFERVGRYAFSAVGGWVQNPTDLTWDARREGLYLKVKE